MCDTACRTNFVVGQYQYVVGPNQYVSNFELVQINSVKFSWSISTGSVTVGGYQVSRYDLLRFTVPRPNTRVLYTNTTK